MWWGNGGAADDTGGNGGAGVRRQLSGVIRTADVSVVDTDINDPQFNGFLANDTLDSAQPVASPVTVVGSVNLGGKGDPAGKNYKWGDADDVFKVPLVAGQVVELLVGLSADAQNDADLCIVSAEGALAGCSLSTGERECVKATTSGDYFVWVNEFSSASVYNLRISAPGQGAPCANEVAPASAMVPGQILGLSAAASKATAQAVGVTAAAAARGTALRAMQAAGVAVRAAAPGSALAVDVIQLPEETAARSEALGTLKYSIAGATVARARQKAAQRGIVAPSALMNTLLTLHYAKALQHSGAYAAAEPNWIMQRLGTAVGTYPPADGGYASQRWHYEQINLAVGHGRGRRPGHPADAAAPGGHHRRRCDAEPRRPACPTGQQWPQLHQHHHCGGR